VVSDLAGVVENFMANRTFKRSIVMSRYFPVSFGIDEFLSDEYLLRIAMMGEVFINVLQVHSRSAGTRLKVANESRRADENPSTSFVGTLHVLWCMDRRPEMLFGGKKNTPSSQFHCEEAQVGQGTGRA
jgi:hypothetical protein